MKPLEFENNLNSMSSLLPYLNENILPTSNLYPANILYELTEYALFFSCEK